MRVEILFLAPYRSVCNSGPRNQRGLLNPARNYAPEASITEMVFGGHSKSGMGLPDLVWHDCRGIAAGNTGSVFGSNDNAASRARRGAGGFCCPEQSRVRGADYIVAPRAGVWQGSRTLGRLWRPGTYFDYTVDVVAPGAIRPHATDYRWWSAPTIVCARRIFDTRVVETFITVISRLPFNADADGRNKDLYPRRVKN